MYAGGIMALLHVIEQEMNNNQLVVRHHVEDFNAKSQLIVYESQEALFYKNGQALDLFIAGRHELKSENVPILRRFFSGLFGGKTPFPCDVYFINKVNVLDVIWGTPSPIELMDPKYDILVRVRANGQTGLRVIDSRKFAVKVVGQLPECSVEEVRRAIKGMMISSIKECIATAIIQEGISILEIATKLSAISAKIQAQLNTRIADLGLAVDHFSIEGIMPSEGDLDALRNLQNRRFDTRFEAERIRELGAAETDSKIYGMKATMAQADADAYVQKTLGYTYQQQRQFDVMQSMAQNEGAAGAFMNMGMGMGMGMGAGQAMNNMAQNLQQPAQPQAQQAPAATKTCPQCGGSVAAGSKFCPNCGQAMPQARFCPECGTRCPENSKFCVNCGTKLDA
jgi:membrane protease subunit (stomatin/prohibitin family)